MKVLATSHGLIRLGAASFPPSEYIREEMDARGWSLKELARRAGLDLEIVTAVIEKDVVYQEGVAQGFAKAFGTSSALWMNLQAAQLAFVLHELSCHPQEPESDNMA